MCSRKDALAAWEQAEAADPKVFWSEEDGAESSLAFMTGLHSRSLVLHFVGGVPVGNGTRVEPMLPFGLGRTRRLAAISNRWPCPRRTPHSSERHPAPSHPTSRPSSHRVQSSCIEGHFLPDMGNHDSEPSAVFDLGRNGRAVFSGGT